MAEDGGDGDAAGADEAQEDVALARAGERPALLAAAWVLDVQVRLIQELLKKTQKRLQIVTVALIAAGTLAVLALAIAVMK